MQVTITVMLMYYCVRYESNTMLPISETIVIVFHCRVEMLMVVVDPFISGLHMHRRDDDFLDQLNHKAGSCFMFFLLFMHTFYQVINFQTTPPRVSSATCTSCM